MSPRPRPTSTAGPVVDSARRETPTEKADRNWNELLQEFRVLQTGVQILAGFLLTLPFQSTFDDLDRAQRGFYLGLVMLAATTTTALMVPIAVHRRVFRWRRKPRLVVIGHRLARVTLVLVGTLIAGIVVFLFDVVGGRTTAAVGGGVMVLAVVVALGVVPRLVGGSRPQEG